ncbi:hypothetical protein [Marinobacter nauticus]|uniref:hypothetical protein n=1 Tax=Marinobacter nauticus TaxID=2743 RepID=UPI003514CEDB
MKHSLRTLVCASLISLPLATFAQGGPGQGSQAGMMNQERIQQMQQNMDRMNQTMQQMQNATTREERQRLRQEHMEHMQEHLQIMRESGMGQA